MRPASLQIPSPCAESWQKMTPQGAGRHCASCQKVVIDFAQKTDAEIIAILSAAAAGNVCGRFKVSQLDRPLHAYDTGRRSSRWSAAVAATVALLGLRELVAPAEARAQAPTAQHPNFGRHSPEPEFVAPKSLRQPDTVKGEVTEIAAPDTVPRTQISGQVVASDGQPLPGVTILLQGTQHGVSTGADGRFILPVEASEQRCTVLVTSIGYVSAVVPQPTDGQPMRVVLQDNTRMLGGLIVTNYYPPIYTPRGVWSRLRSIPYRIANLFR